MLRADGGTSSAWPCTFTWPKGHQELSGWAARLKQGLLHGLRMTMGTPLPEEVLRISSAAAAIRLSVTGPEHVMSQ